MSNNIFSVNSDNQVKFNSDWNEVVYACRQQAEDQLDELTGGFTADADAMRDYINAQWEKTYTDYDGTSYTIPDDVWAEYVDRIISEVINLQVTD